MELGTEQFADPESGTDWQDTEGYGSERQTPPPPRIDATVRAPLEYAYTAIDIMAALPRSQAVDAAALPADLQRKARAHGDDLDNIVESEQLTTRHRRDLIWTEIARVGRFVEPTAKYGAPAAAGIAVVLMVGHWWRHTGTSAVEILVASNPFGYLAIALGAAALLVRFARRRAATAPHWVYTDDELATLEAAGLKGLRVHVNMASPEFHRNTLPEELLALTRRHGLAPAQLSLELTETLVMEQPAQVRAVMERLRAAGFEISLDDFGQGHSALSLLKQLPLSTLKVDRSFVRGLGEPPSGPGGPSGQGSDEAIVRTILDLGRHLGLRVIVEGVETVAQLKRVRACGGQHVQGYLLARPMPLDELLQRFATAG